VILPEDISAPSEMRENRRILTVVKQMKNRYNIRS